MIQILIYIGIGLIGVLAYCLIKANSLQKDSLIAKTEFSIKIYLAKDWFGISMSILSVIMWACVFQETMQQYPKIESYLRLSFLGVGFTGSYILQLAFGKLRKEIRTAMKANSESVDDEEIRIE